MGNVNADGIWTPDEEDGVEQDVNMSAMADSISQGIGVRLKRQETFIGAYLNCAEPFTGTAGVPGHAQLAIPFKVEASGVAYLDGMELGGGRVKAPINGVYSVNATILAYLNSGYLELTLWKNGSRHGQVVSYDDGTANSIGLSHTAVMKCSAGDTMWASIAQYQGDNNSPPTLDVRFHLFNTFSSTLIQAL